MPNIVLRNGARASGAIVLHTEASTLSSPVTVSASNDRGTADIPG